MTTTRCRSNSLVTRRLTSVVAALFITVFAAQRAMPVVLTDGNSTLTINPGLAVTGSSWIVEGVEHMKELSNWYRVGSSGPENNVSTLTVGIPTFDDADVDGGGFDTITVPYSDSLGRFYMEIDYSVFGGAVGSGQSAFDEEIRITNLSTTTPLVFHFYEYIDLDLNRYTLPQDDTVLLTSQNSIRQFDSTTVGNWGMNVDRYELNTHANTLAKLTNGGPDNLSSVWPAGQGPVGPGDVTFALQWDFIGSAPPRPAIPPQTTVVITKEGLLQMTLIPEPASCSLLFCACAMLLTLRPRR